jgi:hypothetical protein
MSLRTAGDVARRHAAGGQNAGRQRGEAPVEIRRMQDSRAAPASLPRAAADGAAPERLTVDGPGTDDPGMTTLERAEAAEHALSRELDGLAIVKSVIYTSGEHDPRVPVPRPPHEGKRFLMGHDPRLPRMPDRPTLFDFFRYRFAPATHLLQSARLAQKNGMSEKVVLACLVHDIAIAGFIRGDHGYWAAQMVEPYVDEEVSWAIRYHQALRFFPDESVGYRYPELYAQLFGPDYEPEPYIQRAHRYARAHRWYMTARLLTVNDLYAFDPGVQVELDEFADVVGRNFKQPEEGLGLDASPSAHMWRTIMWPTRYL